MSQPPPNVSAPFSQLSLSPSFYTTRSQFLEQYASEICDAIFTRDQLAFSITAIHPILEAHPTLGAAIADVVLAVVKPLRAEIKTLQTEIKTLKSNVEELRDDKMSLKEDKRNLQETIQSLRDDKAKLRLDKSKLQEDKSNLQEDKSKLQLDKERYATLIENLEEHLAYMHVKERQFLEHGYRTHDIFEGSLGRRKLWQKVADSVRHEEHPRSSTKLSRAHKNHIRRLMAAVFVSDIRREYKVDREAQMYPLVQETLHKILSDSKNDNQVAVIDTNNSSYLPGIAPDMSLSLCNMVRPLAACMYGVLELKRCANKELQDDKNLGQVYDYLLSIKRSQPNRHVFLGILSNIRCSVVMTIEGDQNRITMYSPASWEDMVVYLLDHVCKQDSVFAPAPLPFTIGIEYMQKQLGVTRRSMVASFQYLNHGSIAIKCASKQEFGSAIRREVSILRKLTHRNLPQLIYDPSPEELEFGIKPVGRAFALHVFPSASTLRSALLETLSALDWLHTTPNIIHRDIRRDNIILDKLHPVIIDFDHAVDLSIVSPTTTFLYEGGYICCPREVLNHDDPWRAQYRPKPAHDLSGFLLFVVECLFPSRVAAFRSSKVLNRNSSERGALLTFWREMEQSGVWGRWLRAAESRDVEMLKGLVELVAWPSTKGCEVSEVRVVGEETSSGMDSFESVNNESSGSIV